MALAKLCHDVIKDQSRLKPQLYAQPGYPRIQASFTAFIVNHKIRENSGSEARKVANELTRLEIEPHVLELDWRAYGNPSTLTNIESVARRLRYQALGRACYANRIDSLLVAHHADDQGETVLSRIINGYTGAGLGGMRGTAPIPECAGIYGVDHSGRHERKVCSENDTYSVNKRILFESQGINIARPLLHFSKEQLIDICKQGRVRWFEDQTNTDLSLTLRNTVRFLQKENVLPTALRQERLSSLADDVRSRHEEFELKADSAFRQTLLTLNLQLGEAEFTVERASQAQTEARDMYHAALMRKMLETVAPTDTISLQDLDQATDFVFRSDERPTRPRSHDPRPVVQIAGVDIQKHRTETPGLERRTITFCRRVPTERERVQSALKIGTFSSGDGDSEDHAWSDWHLWDGRYWIRVARPEDPRENLDIFVRFLAEQDVTQLRQNVPRWRVDQLFKVAKGKKRWTLPAIVARHRKGSNEEAATSPEEILVALPSLGWSVEGWSHDNSLPNEEHWLWDIRYKHVKLDRAGGQKIIP